MNKKALQKMTVHSQLLLVVQTIVTLLPRMMYWIELQLNMYCCIFAVEKLQTSLHISNSILSSRIIILAIRAGQI